MDTIAKNSTDLPHDAWRVQFLKRLLSVHRNAPLPHDEGWRMQEQDYLKQIAIAEEQLRYSALHEVQ